jgi:hypothetical protein
MLHEEQEQTAHTSNSWHESTMPCKGLQARELPDEELGRCLMKRPVARYRHAKEY